MSGRTLTAVLGLVVLLIYLAFVGWVSVAGGAAAGAFVPEGRAIAIDAPEAGHLFVWSTVAPDMVLYDLTMAACETTSHTVSCQVEAGASVVVSYGETAGPRCHRPTVHPSLNGVPLEAVELPAWGSCQYLPGVMR